MGIVSLKGSESKERKLLPSHEPIEGLNPGCISFCMQLPCFQIAQFTGIQAVIESLASAKKVNVIDLAITTGEHCAVLMQALKNRQEGPVELLKITAVGTQEAKLKIKEVDQCLTSFSKTLNLPLLFSPAILSHIKYLNKEIFKICDDEVLAIFSLFEFRKIKALPDGLPSLLSVLRNLNPCVLVIVEFEANHGSPIFIDRFLESLHFYSACYDCTEACGNAGDQSRLTIEAYMGKEIKDIIAAKDEERIFENMKIDEWRAYLSRFGMIETEVSVSSFYQAELLLKKFDCEKSCSVVRNGQCLVTDWKGTPFFSVSAWKFKQTQSKKSCTNKSKGLPVENYG